MFRVAIRCIISWETDFFSLIGKVLFLYIFIKSRIVIELENSIIGGFFFCKNSFVEVESEDCSFRIYFWYVRMIAMFMEMLYFSGI